MVLEMSLQQLEKHIQRLSTFIEAWEVLDTAYDCLNYDSGELLAGVMPEQWEHMKMLMVGPELPNQETLSYYRSVKDALVYAHTLIKSGNMLPEGDVK